MLTLTCGMIPLPKSTSYFERSLAATQAAAVAAPLMLLWDGIASSTSSHSFWTVPNLMAGLFYGPASLRPDFGIYTLAGIAIQVLSCTCFAILFAAIIPPSSRLLSAVLLGILAATSWFYLLDGFFWRRAYFPFTIYSKRPSIFFSFVLLGICVGLYSIFVRSEQEN